MSKISTPPKKFALIAQTTSGIRLRTGGFTCIPADRICIVYGPAGCTDPNQLWIKCNHGRHYLSGQVSLDSREYIGLYSVEEELP